MIRSKIYLIFVVIMALLSYSTYSLCDNNKERKTILVTAKATKSKLVSDDSDKYPNAAFHPMTFNITFKDIKVELGESPNYPSKAKFDINIRTDYMILNAKRVSLLIDITNPTNHKLLDLDIISSVTCFSEELLDKVYNDIYFKMSFKNMDGKKCVILTDEYTPPE